MIETEAAPGTVCLITIHGIGFQRAPGDAGPDGYADLLHEHLSAKLRELGADELLSDDPYRQAGRGGQAGKFGAIYVQSEYRVAGTGPESVEEGLRRLGVWTTGDRRQGSDEVVPGEIGQLTEPGRRIAHIALVYAHPENRAFQHLGAATETFAKTVASALNYGSPWDIAHMFLADIKVAGGSGPPGPISLRPRARPHRARTSLRRTNDDPSNPPGVLGVIRALEEDISTYVCRNDLRENVRGFVREALLRLCSRQDVDILIINAHSQGTTVAFDVLRTLPPWVFSKIRVVMTSGSPLRKYATLYTWGTQWRTPTGEPGALPKWLNFFDRHDIVSEPLRPLHWEPGSEADPTTLDAGLFQLLDDSGAQQAYAIQDIEVFNTNNSPRGGYPPHNYWDNQKDWIPTVAERLRTIAGA
jgi:hypothetical protein